MNYNALWVSELRKKKQRNGFSQGNFLRRVNLCHRTDFAEIIDFFQNFWCSPLVGVGPGPENYFAFQGQN